MSFVKLGNKIYNTDQILCIEDYFGDEENQVVLCLLNKAKIRLQITMEEALEALGPSLIQIGGMYLDPDEVLAVSAFTDAQNAVVPNKALIWLGPNDGEYFAVPVSIEEAVALINKG